MTDKEVIKTALEALNEIAEGKGRYDMDRLKHASNTIKDMIGLVKDAINKINEQKGNIMKSHEESFVLMHLFKGIKIDSEEEVTGCYFISPLTDENSGTTPDKGWFFLTGEKRHCISDVFTGVVHVVNPESLSYIGVSDDTAWVLENKEQ